MTNPPGPNDSGAHRASDDVLWQVIRDETRETHELLAEIARDMSGAAAFLGRTLLARDFVVLKLEPESTAADGHPHYSLLELRELDDTVPAPRSTCPICSAPAAMWRGRCPACGGAIGVPKTESPNDAVATDLLLSFYQYAAVSYNVIGELQQAGGGPPVYFATARGSDELFALRLAVAGTQAGGGMAYAVDALALRRRGAASVAAPTRVPLVVVPPVPPGSTPKTPVPGATVPTGGGERVCPQCGSHFGPDTMFCAKDGAPLRPVSGGDDLVGQLIDDRYYVERRLGEGGMGEVYIAHQVRTGRMCAIKLMHRTLTQDADAMGRFRREAASACAISHANVATIYDSGETKDGRPYFAMEFVDGRSLAQVIQETGPIDALRATNIARQIADGLAAAHDLDIVHRDLKPDNVMIGSTRGGVEFVKLVDFGIAKPTSGGASTITRTGFILGTPAYMSPEQISGDRLDGRTDLYSLGCVLYQMLTGSAPFSGDTIESVMMRRLSEPPPHPRAVNESVPPSLDVIVTTLLQREPEQRYQNAREASDALLDVQRELERLSPRSAVSASQAGQQSAPATVTTVHRPSRPSQMPVPPAPVSPSVPMRSPSPARPVPAAGGAAAAAAARSGKLAGIEDTLVPLGNTPARPSQAIYVPEPPRPITPEAPVEVEEPAPSRSRLVGAVLVVAALSAAGYYTLQFVKNSNAARPRDTLPSVVGPIPSTGTQDSLAARSDSNVTPTGRTAGAGPPGAAGVDQPERGAESSAAHGAARDRRPTAGSSTGQNPTTPVTPPASTQAPPTQPQQTPPETRAPVVDTRVADSVAAAEKAKADAAAAEAAEVARVRSVVEQYVRAINSKRVDDLRGVFPSMEPRVREGFETMFSRVSDLTAQLIGEPTITLHGSTADATFTYELKGRDPSRGTFSNRSTVRALLQRTGQGWVFERIGAGQ